jgi:hypothetical protein
MTGEEEDQWCILIIGGIIISLPRIPVEVDACVAGAEEEGHQIETFMEEEKEQDTEIFPRDERRGGPHSCEPKECSGGEFKCHTHLVGDIDEITGGLVRQSRDRGTGRKKNVRGDG